MRRRLRRQKLQRRKRLRLRNPRQKLQRRTRRLQWRLPLRQREGTDPVANLIAATTGTVTLKVWASEEDQDLTTKLLDEFKAAYPDVTFDITLGAESESTAKDTVLTDVEAAADVYAFADDQINDLVNAARRRR